MARIIYKEIFMKTKIINILNIISVGIIVFFTIIFFILAGFAFFISGLFTEPTRKNFYSEKDSKFICDKIKYNLNENESVSTVYRPTILQGTGFIEITIHNIDSQTGFLNRFTGKIISEKEIYGMNIDDVNNEYNENYSSYILKTLPENFDFYSYSEDFVKVEIFFWKRFQKIITAD